MSRNLSDPVEAEYHRLHEKLHSLARRNAWSGAERAYQDMITLGREPEFDDHLVGASAARSIGDVTSARARLVTCNRIEESREVMDWLWEIDSVYGMVQLYSDPGASELVVEQMPFDPSQAGAVRFAQEQIAATGIFEGYLPGGIYHFGGYDVKVRPRVSAEQVDVRTDEGIKAAEKAAKAEAKKKKDASK